MGGAIAVVGAGCRFPGGVHSPADLWKLLLAGTDVVTEVPPSRWDLDRYYDPDPHAPGRMYSRHGAFLPDADRFDAAFFGIAPREARQMDPQQRLLLETAWSALEDAGIVPATLAGSRTAVFTAALGADYLLLHGRQAGEAGIDPWHMSGKEASFGPGRLSYLLGLNGPTMSVSTACSSSLVGLHLARQSLLTGESDLALVGGASLQLSPDLTLFMCRIGAMSHSGRCRVFDAGADGIVRGDGCVMLVLKRLDDALADRDGILAVVRGSAVNHDGRSAGLTVPNGVAQQDLLRTALRSADVAAAEIGYVEAHGTGTPLGDPIEVGSLARVYGAERSQPLMIGSVKTNLGHTDSVSGMAGLLKAALAMRHGTVPPHLNLAEPNPAIRWDSWPVEVPTETVDWPDPGRPRLAGVSSFGLSGTNAHVILEAAPAVPPAGTPPGGADDTAPRVLALAATSGAALTALARAHREGLSGSAVADAAELAAYLGTAGSRRSHHPERRLAVAGRDAGELAERLAERLGEDLDRAPLGSTDAEAPSVVFVFSGQGAQWPGMATGLIGGEPVFVAALRECDAAIEERAGWSVLEALRAPAEHSPLQRTEFAQPAVFAVQVALARLWQHWGVLPAALVGHSMGEITAAHVGGALTLGEAAGLIVHRGRLLQQTHGTGRMAAIRLPEHDVAAELAALSGAVWVSAVNGPASTVVSGETEAVRALVAHLTERGVQARLMPGEYAFHTPALRPLGQELAAEVVVAPSAPTVPLEPTTAGAAPGGTLDPDHWGRNVSEPVRFGAAVDRLVDAGHRVFLELGAHPVLVGPILESLRARRVEGVAAGSLRRGQEDRDALGDGLVALYEAGVQIDWTAVRPWPGPPAEVPTYPWTGPPLWFARDESGRDVPPAPVPAAAPVAHADIPAGPPRSGDLAELVAGSVADVLGFESAGSVRRTQGFTEMGMDSVGTVALGERLSAVLGVPIGKTAPFDHPTVRRLTEHLATLLVEGVPQFPEPAVGPGTLAAAADSADADGLPPNAIAVVGIGCRFPGGVNGPDDYWQLLRAGVDAIGPAPEGRFPNGETWPGGYLEGIDEFDAAFFRIPPREARGMDPQQRMFLEVSWEALEHAGIPAASLAGSRTGVFTGMNSHDYAELVAANPGNVDASYGTGISFAASAGRLSYFLGLHGPSLAVDTACSSSLVAVHLALRSLRSGECDVAVAGGVNLIVKPVIHESSGLAGALAADGRCKTFDASADGYTRAEGCGVVVLKPLAKALADGDEIYAMLLGSAVNNDGASGGLTVPNGPAQQDVLRSALADADVAPGEVGYVEAHGTGTPLGDPIELNALGDVLRGRSDADRCPVGSVKTNIGHLEAASGIAGLIKAVLAVHHRRIPRQIHLRTPTPEVSWSSLPVRVADTEQEWTAERRVAGVSAFGLTGTNAHVVLGSMPPIERPRSGPETGRLVLPVSAPSAAALPAQAEAYRALLVDPGHPEAAALCRTAALRRTHFDHRLAVHGVDGAELAARLDEFVHGGTGPGIVTGVAGSEDAGPVFVFSGYGSQWPRMAADLLDTDEVFAAAVRRCDEALGRHLDWSVLEALRTGVYPGSELNQQLLIFSIQVALFERWRAWGVHPSAVVGHSMGEVAAAHATGALDLDQAAEVMARRTRLLHGLLGQGGMAVVGLPEAQLLPELAAHPDRMWVSGVNSGQNTVLSGTIDALDELTGRLRARNVFTRMVTAGGPGHSPFADPLRAALSTELEHLAPAAGPVPLYSSVRGRRVDGAALDARYWGDNIRLPVRFADAVRALIADGHRDFLELSPHPVLLQAIGQELRDSAAQPVRGGVSAASLRRDEPGGSALSAGLAALHAHGLPVDWDAVLPAADRVVAGRYAWQHRSYWVEHDRPATGMPSTRPARHPLLVGSVAPPDSPRHLFEAEVTAEAVAGHRAVGPETSAVWVELVAATALELTGHRGARVVDLDLHGHGHGVDAPVLAQVEVTGDFRGRALRLYDGTGRGGHLIAAGIVDLDPWQTPAEDGLPTSVEPDLVEWWSEAVGGLDLGLRVVRADTDRVEVIAEMPAVPGRWVLPPRVLPIALELARRATGLPDAVPVRIGSMVVHAAAAAERVRIVVTVLERGSDPSLTIRAELLDGTPLVHVDAMTLRGTAAHVPVLPVQRMRWREQPWPQASEGAASAGRWLLLADGFGVADQVARALEERGGDAVLLRAPQDGAAVRGAVRALREQGGFRGVVHLWTLDVPGAVPDDRGMDEAAWCYRSAAETAAALGFGAGPDERLWFVTRHGCAVGDLDVPAGLRAPMWTLAGITGLEHPAVWGGVLDLEPHGVTPREDAGAVVDAMLAGDGEDHVAVRSGRRLVARIEHSDDSPARTDRPFVARGDASYLVAGGGGRFAAELAERLAERGARRIVLAGASAAVAGPELEASLAAQGVELAVAAGDPADPDAAAAIMRGAAGAPVTGVFWLGMNFLLDTDTATDPALALADGRARALGAWQLHRACEAAGVAPDHFVVCTGLAAEWGAPGSGRTAVGDGALRALVATRAARGLPAVGVAVPAVVEPDLSDAMSRSRLARSGLSVHDATFAADLLDRLCTGVRGTFFAAEADWGLLLRMYRQAVRWPLFDELEPQESGAEGDASPAERLAGLDAAARRDTVVDWVLTELAIVLGVASPDDLDPEQGFFELGMNSVTSLELRVRLERRFACALPATLAFEYPNATVLAEYLIGELAIAGGEVPSEEQPQEEPAAWEERAPATTRPQDEPQDEQEDLLARFDEEMTAANSLL
ncbi:type I polyketide synthase [Pseudonocardia sp. MH-G8]|uniref:type I polyketide synthase n=1 Tax=Pseudonocardia sp. MH-G8 TaxID=1854588 RepID=UPI00130446DE|nr:type I polyketide synthase [Pseudonocardia sp. MH-G8]